MNKQEGFIPVVGEYRVWYRIVGGGAERENIPLLALHGGPGVPHDYIENLATLASYTRWVIFYDQLGCGRSDQPDDTSLWRVERFVEELGIVRRELGLERIHLLGQSWGGILAIEYMLTRPERCRQPHPRQHAVKYALWFAEANRLRKELPQRFRQHCSFTSRQARPTILHTRKPCRSSMNVTLFASSPMPDQVQAGTSIKWEQAISYDEWPH